MFSGKFYKNIGAAMTEQTTEFLAQTKKIIESLRIFPVKEIL
jgi:hypothetical protein